MAAMKLESKSTEWKTGLKIVFRKSYNLQSAYVDKCMVQHAANSDDTLTEMCCSNKN